MNEFQKSYKYGKILFPSENVCNKFFDKTDSASYQEYINDAFRKYALSDSVVIDIGANFGIFTFSFSSINPTCQIHAFEPVSDTFQLLSKSRSRYDTTNIFCHNTALGNFDGTTPIQYAPTNPGISSISRKIDKSVQVDINIKTLDSYNFQNISFIKIDVESYELEVLKGGQNTLINNDITLVIEIPKRNKNEIKHHNNCKNLLRKYGYKYFKRIGNKDYIFRKHSFA